jgi:hypothetical protein
MSARHDMQGIRTGLRIVSILTIAGSAAACGGGGFSGMQLGGAGAGAPGEPAIAQPAKPPVSLAGRWMLAQPGRGQCAMTFRSSAEGVTGTIAPEGGCPGKFFTSRKWSYDSAGLSILDHNSRPLAQLSGGTTGQFAGKAATGEPVTLTR